MPAVKNHRPPPLAPGTVPAPVPLQTQTPVAAAAVPRGRPSWSGLLRLSLVSVPVKAYPAVSSSSASHFHLLHAGCLQRITYAKNCPLLADLLGGQLAVSDGTVHAQFATLRFLPAATQQAIPQRH